MPQISTHLAQKHQKWVSTPKPGHVVHFYPADHELVASLVEYIGNGLQKGDTCIVIATPKNLISLNKRLRSQGIDISAAISSNQYITYDAEELLESFMYHGVPNLERFLEVIGNIISLSSGRARPIRAFGEMIAVLLKKGDLEGVVRLETYWNSLVKDHAFSLYCAYPEADFNSSLPYRELMNRICTCHSLATGNLA